VWGGGGGGGLKVTDGNGAGRGRLKTAHVEALAICGIDYLSATTVHQNKCAKKNEKKYRGAVCGEERPCMTCGPQTIQQAPVITVELVLSWSGIPTAPASRFDSGTTPDLVNPKMG
jgi:hypothetical protein